MNSATKFESNFIDGTYEINFCCVIYHLTSSLLVEYGTRHTSSALFISPFLKAVIYRAEFVFIGFGDLVISRCCE